ncbi:MAG TPA: hypothetical protein VGT05_04970 [Patescibacteria group bacterium]|nr:hypothetical protein [Patescibacteria group bacterium]
MKLLAALIGGGASGNTGGAPLSINGQTLPLPGYLQFNAFTVISGFITLLFLAVTLIALMYMVYNGFIWLTSGGDNEKLEKAKRSITYTIFGLAFAFLAFLIVNVIGFFFNVHLVNWIF